MLIEKNISLKSLNTFNIDVKAKYFVKVNNTSELMELLTNSDYKLEKKLFIGGGSNILFTSDFDGIVIKLSNSEINILSETDEKVTIKVDSGVEWDNFVKFCVDRSLSGIENLSLIPGNVGASPIQNIGAYGVEVKDLIESVNLILLVDLESKSFTNSQCNFGYRNSIFKNELKNQFVITSVVFNISKKKELNLKYAPLLSYFADKNESEITSKEIREAIIKIRTSKLPDPKMIGNAGSFFKNPVIPKEQFEKILEKHPDLTGYPESNSTIKISAGWLIEKCGLKGKRVGNVGIHENQALVIVNYGNASGNEILQFSKMVENEVKNKFDINLINEVNIL